MKKDAIERLSSLCNAHGASGYERDVIDMYTDQISDYCHNIEIDTHGNAHAIINPESDGPCIVVMAHIDEIGLQVCHVDSDGFIWFKQIGGWDAQVVKGQSVQIKTESGIISGVIGSQAIHLQNPNDRDNITKTNDQWIDIGAKNKADALKSVCIGDPVVIDRECILLKNKLISGKALDDRACVFAGVELAKKLFSADVDARIHIIASLQEEIGVRGAVTATYNADPDYGFAMDVTFATDYPNVGEAKKFQNDIKLGKGPVVARGANISEELYNIIKQAASDNEIPVQFNTWAGMTGTDARAIQISRGGVPTALVSLPLRYMHSPNETASLKDIDNLSELVFESIKSLVD